MAILVLWGAITKCEPIRLERKQLNLCGLCLGEEVGVRTLLEGR